MKNSNFLTVDEIARNLKVTRQTVSKYIQSNKLNAVKINKSYRIAQIDFEAFLNENATIEEPRVSYLKRTKNCHLEYSNKADEFEILFEHHIGEIKEIEINHSKVLNQFIFGDNLFVLRYLLDRLEYYSLT